MGAPTSTAAYEDVSGLLDEAIQTPKGIRVIVPSRQEGTKLAQRLNSCRQNYRKRSKRENSPGDPAYGTTPWDGIRITLGEADDKHYVYLTKYSGITYETEELD